MTLIIAISVTLNVVLICLLLIIQGGRIKENKKHTRKNNKLCNENYGNVVWHKKQMQSLLPYLTKAKECFIDCERFEEAGEFHSIIQNIIDNDKTITKYQISKDKKY